MSLRWTMAAACAAMALSAAAPASAACAIKGALPIKIEMEGISPILTLKVNGAEGRFLLDSGSQVNAISSKMAAAQKLKPMAITGIDSRIPDSAGTDGSGAAGRDVRNGVMVAQQVEFVGTVFKNVAFMASDSLGGVDGLIGQSTLSQFDVEYDLHGGLVRLVKLEGCGNTDIVYWAKEGTPYSKISMDKAFPEDLHTKSVVFINGVKMRAVFDTGAGNTFITKRAAERAGIKTGDAGVQPVPTGYQGLDGHGNAWVGTFKSVKIGDEEIQNAPMTIGDSDADWFDVLVGADFFLSHHVYVANSQGKIYFAYGGGPVFYAPSVQAAGK
jgi:predicted aspartyl protease